VEKVPKFQRGGRWPGVRRQEILQEEGKRKNLTDGRKEEKKALEGFQREEEHFEGKEQTLPPGRVPGQTKPRKRHVINTLIGGGKINLQERERLAARKTGLILNKEMETHKPFRRGKNRKGGTMRGGEEIALKREDSVPLLGGKSELARGGEGCRHSSERGMIPAACTQRRKQVGGSHLPFFKKRKNVLQGGREILR